MTEQREAASIRVCKAALEFVGPNNIRLVRERDASNDTLIGALAHPKWTRLVEAVAAWDSLRIEESDD